MTPSMLQSTSWPTIVKGRIVAPLLPTCNESTYDFFVVADALAHVVRGVQRVEDAGLKPHFPSRLLIAGDARRHAIRKLVKPGKVEGALPHGPTAKPKPEAFRQVSTDGSCSAAEAHEAMQCWYKGAREEFMSLTGRHAPHTQHKLVWGSAGRRIASQYPGSNFESSCWRAAASAAHDAAKLWKAPENRRTAVWSVAVLAHTAALRLKLRGKCPTIPADQLEQMRSWCSRLEEANLVTSSFRCASLAKVATIKAEKVETALCRARQNGWKEALGAGLWADGRAKAPTRLAYRWAKGFAGWTRSCVAARTELQDDVIPDEPCELHDDDLLATNASAAAERPRCIAPTDLSGRIIPLSDQQTADREGEGWGEWWKIGEAYHDPWARDRANEVEAESETIRNDFEAGDAMLRADILALPELWACMIATAAMTFPAATGLGVDNIAPRAVTRLSDVALQN